MGQGSKDNQARVQDTAIEGLLIIKLDVHKDARGWF